MLRHVTVLLGDRDNGRIVVWFSVEPDGADTTGRGGPD